MKISVSLTEEDLTTIDEYAESSGIGTRSGVVQAALRLLRQGDLEADYAAAFDEWAESGDAVAWDQAAGDGISRA